MVRTNNGFEIAEVDLELRGPGDVAGTMQSGTLQLKIADLVRDQPILLAARETALTIIEKDAALKMPEHASIVRHLIWMNRDQSDWSKIS